MEDRYPQKRQIRYAKAGTPFAPVTMTVYDFVNNKKMQVEVSSSPNNSVGRPEKVVHFSCKLGLIFYLIVGLNIRLVREASLSRVRSADCVSPVNLVRLTHSQ